MSKILVEIVGDSKRFKSALGSAGRDAETFGSKVHGHATGALKGLGIAAAGGAAIGVGLLAKGLMDGVKTAVEHEKALAQTNAVIKSTGGGAKVSAGHILALSDKIEKMTGIDDLATQAGSNMLLTFTNIKNGAGAANKVFDQSVSVLADMTTALGSDPQKQAIQLGKALNDPIKGISALTRVGVTFSAQQKKNIAAMVEHGNTAGAQKIILKELQKEFGGSAQAAGQTMGGQLKILQAHLEDTEQLIGQKVLPVLNDLIAWAIKNWPTFQIYAEMAMKAIGDAWNNVLKPTIDVIVAVIGAMISTVRAHWDQIAAVFAAAFKTITGFIDLFIAVFKGDWGAAWTAIKQIVSGAWDLIKADIKLVGPVLLAALKAVGEKMLEGLKDGLTGLLDLALAGVKAIPGGLLALGGLILAGASALGGKIVDGIVDAVTGIAGKVAGFVNNIPGRLLELVKAMAGAGATLGGAIVSSIVDAFTGLAGKLVAYITDALNSAFGVFNSAVKKVKSIGGTSLNDLLGNPLHLAAGGIVTRPTVALIGESGPEAVIPLSGRGGGAGGGGGGGVTVIVNGWVGNDQEIAEKIRNALIRTGRSTTGGALGGFA